MPAEVKVNVNIDEKNATKILSEIDALVTKLNGKKINISVNATGQQITQLQNFANGIGNIGTAATTSAKAVDTAFTHTQKVIKVAADGTQSYVDTYKKGVAETVKISSDGSKQITKNYEAQAKAEAKAQADYEKSTLKAIETNEKAVAAQEKANAKWEQDTLKAIEYNSKAYDKYVADQQAKAEAEAKAQADLAKAQQEAADKRLATIGRVAKVAATAFLIKETKEALSTMKDVDSELANIQKVTDESAEAMKRLGEAAYDTASKYGVSATEYLASASEFAKAGYNNYADLSELAIKTQLVGDVSADVASKFLLSADAAYKFGGNIDQLSGVLDRANVIENNYATSIYKIAEGMPIVASTAAMANMSIDELMAGLGTITAVTQETGRKAATALRALILNIEGEIGTVIDEDMTITQESVESMADALKKYGNEAVKAAQKTGQLVDPMEAIKSLAEAYKNGDLGDQELFDILSSLGGKLRTNQLTALVKNFDMFSEMLGKVQDAAGSAEKEIDVMLETWNAKTNILKNSWTELVSTIINSDTIKSGIDLLSGVIKGLSDFLQTEVGEIAGKFVGLAVIFTTVGNLIKTVFASSVGEAIIGTFKAIVTAITGSGGVVSALKTLGTALLHSPVAWGALAAAGVLAFTMLSKTAEEKYQEAVDNVEKLVEEYNKLYGKNGVLGQEIDSLASSYDTLNQKERERLSLLQAQEESARNQIMYASMEAYEKWLTAYTRPEAIFRGYEDNNGVTEAAYDWMSAYTQKAQALNKELAELNNPFASGHITAEGQKRQLADILNQYKDFYEYIEYWQKRGQNPLENEEIKAFYDLYTDALHQYDALNNQVAESNEQVAATASTVAGATTDAGKAVDGLSKSLENANSEEFDADAELAKFVELANSASSQAETLQAWGVELNDTTAASAALWEELNKVLADGEEQGKSSEEIIAELKNAVDEFNYSAETSTTTTDELNESLDATAESANNAASAIKKFQDATASTKSGNADAYRSAYQGFLTDYEAGKTDTNVVRAAMDMFVTPEMQKALGYNMQAIGEVLASDLYKGIYNGASGNAGVDFVNYMAENMTEALDEIVNITQGADGTYNFEFASMAKLAEYFELPLAAIEALVGALDEFGVQAGIGWEDAEKWAEAVGLIGENAGKSEISLESVAKSIFDLGKTDPTEIRKIFDALNEGGFLEGLGDFSDAEIGEAIATVVEQAKTEADTELEFTANTSEAESSIQTLKDEALAAQGPYTVTFNIATNGSIPKFGVRALPFAEGTKDAPGGMALVNELGPELISDNGRAYIANGGKPAIVSLGKGAVVLTAEETRQALGNATIYNGINAYKGGLANTPYAGNKATGATGVTNNSSSKWQEYYSDPNSNKSSSDSSSSSSSSDPWKDREDALKDALAELDELAEWYHNQKKHEDEANTYQKAIEKVDALRKQYLDAGFAETSKEVTTLANKIFDYEEDVADAKAHAIEDLEEELDNLEAQIELAENQGDLQRMLELQNEAQKKVADLIGAYRAAGFSDTSPEILKLANMGYGYASDSGSTTKDLWEKLIDALEAMQETQDEANDLAEKQLAVDEAREALQNAQNQRTVRIFNPITGQWEWVADSKSIQQAQESLKSAEESLLKEQQSQELSALKKAMENGGSLSDVTIGPGLSALLSGASLEQTNAFASALGVLSGGLATTADTSTKSIFDSVDSHDTVTQYTFNGVTIDAETARSTTLAELTEMITPLALTTNMPA